MKLFARMTALAVSALGCLTLLAGCGTSLPAELPDAQPAPAELTAETSAPEEATPVALTPAEAPPGADTADAADARPAAPLLREVRFTTEDYGMNGLFRYNADGQLETVDVSMNADLSDPLFTLTVDRVDGHAQLHLDQTLVDELAGTPGQLTDLEMVCYADGEPRSIDLGFYEMRTCIDFAEDGLPTYFSAAQEDCGYLLDYTRGDAGQAAFAGAQFVTGHTVDAPGTPAQPTTAAQNGEVRYW